MRRCPALPLPPPQNPMPPFQNDVRRGFERLVRKLLNYPNRPAVVLMHAYQVGGRKRPMGKGRG